MKYLLYLLPLLLCFSSCKKDAVSCTNEIKPSSKHKVSDQQLRALGSKLDIIEAIGNLQITSISEDQYGTVIKCNQIHEGLEIMSSSYSFIWRHYKPLVNTTGIIVDSIDISTVPIVDAKDAALIASKSFSPKKCYEAQLGIYDVSRIQGQHQENLQLVWRVTPIGDRLPYTIISATTGELFAFDSGIRY